MAVNRADALVILGATGDLARLQTFPALVGLVARGMLDVPVIGVGCGGWDAERFRHYASASLHGAGIDPGHKDSRRMLNLLRYVDGDLTDETTFAELAKLLPAKSRTLFYLEVPPALFRPVVAGIGRAGLAAKSRIMVEKPSGTHLRSARRLNEALHEVFDEEDVYRVDHWLGPEPVQNVLFTRFTNTIVEPLLDRDHVESIQITMAEACGVADRASWYDRTGAVRDVVQNHLIQVLATVLMDPPAGGGPGLLRDERARLIRALSPLSAQRAVLGQYDGYRQVTGVAPESTVETYAAVRLHADTWRWAGVPILIRAGKCLPVTATEVTVRFRRPPRNVFDVSPLPANSLRWRIWPDSAVTFTLNGAQPGPVPGVQTGEATFLQTPGEEVRPDDRLIGAALNGEHWQFARADTVEAAWRIVDPLLRGGIPVHPYRPGSWGPAEADRLLLRGEAWHDPA